MFKRLFSLFSFVVPLALLGVTAAADVDQISVKPKLSEETAAVGDSIEFRIGLPGVSGRVAAPQLEVDGLQCYGPQISNNFTYDSASGARSEATLVYTIQPERAGTFTIPAQRFRAGDKMIVTQQVVLKVQDEQSNPNGKGGLDPKGTVEIVLPKKTAYIGEVLPVEIHMYVDSAVRWALAAPPTLDGEGFTKSKLSNGQKGVVERNGREYDEVIFRATITPIKAGVVRIGPSEIDYQAQIPRAQPKRHRNPFDPFFGDDFFNDPFGAFTQVENKKAVTEGVQLTVKSLPTQGRPANFSGAVGQFAFSGEGSPNRVKMGDPVTMKLKVGGSGNFDRVNAPVLTDADGWRSYPATSNFKPDDEFGSHGIKTFEVAVIPETKKTQMPVFEFSYFDPVMEKYETASSGHIPLEVEGKIVPPPTPANVVHAQPTGATPAPAPVPHPEVNDIHGIAYDFGKVRSFQPLYLQRGFLAAQAVPALLLGGSIIGRFRKPRVDKSQSIAWKKERSAQLSKMRKESDPTAFYGSAARALQIEAALVSGQNPDSIDSATVCRVLEADEESAATIENVFQVRGEALYAGRGGNHEGIPDTTRRRIIATIENLGS